jgi:hypothetical protein
MDNYQKEPLRNKSAWIRRPNPRIEKLLGSSYRKDQLIIFFKTIPTEKDIRAIKDAFEKKGFRTADIKISSCGHCKVPVQLWSARGIHTLLSTNSVKAGSGPQTTETVGESYSFNYYNYVPSTGKERRFGKAVYGDDQGKNKKEQIVVAVLDTGIDTHLVNPAYVWTESPATLASECYKDVQSGWNFSSNNGNFQDDNPGRHGSIVSQYIINEFKHSAKNTVRIMPLKTHDKDGIGDLFSIICAIHFAIAKGANIINASWGFYYYYELPIPYLKDLITIELKKKGILFVTAAGNKIDADDEIAKQIFLTEQGIALTDDQLRNLEIHNFYPAHLSTGANSVLSVTTTDGSTVSATQNYSEQYIDLGVMTDGLAEGSMKFKIPFESIGGTTDDISGSSFAAAIASGILGAHTSKSLFAPNLKKSDFLTALSAQPDSSGAGTLLEHRSVLAGKYISAGACIKKQ